MVSYIATEGDITSQGLRIKRITKHWWNFNYF